MSAASHWGEFPSQEDHEYTPDVTADIERSMNYCFLDEYESDDNFQKFENIKLPGPDPRVLYAITLHKYAISMSERIEMNKLSKQSDDKDTILPHFPKEFVPNRGNFKFIPKQLDKCEEIDVPTLNKPIVKEVLTKCIATIFAHIGYETSEQSAMDFMTDVLGEFLKKICHSYRTALEDEQRQLAGFPHAIERTLTELGLGGIKGIHDFYQSRLVKYIYFLHKRCSDLHDQYHTMLIPKSVSPVDKLNKLVRVKVEEEDVVEVENPEVHFSTIDGDMNFSILETGYQLLNSLEAETNLQSLGEAEEDVVNESPGVVPVVSEGDLSHLSPYSKKKRFNK